MPLTHEDGMTFQNVQGKTIRGPEGQPKGYVLDLFKPGNMGPEEYFQHLYMSLGRGRRLAWTLLRNFPVDAEGECDWNVFEQGPPKYLCEFLAALEAREKKTYPRLVRAQRELSFPCFERLPNCPPDPAIEGKYLYNPLAWGFPDRRGHGTDAVPSSASTGTVPLRKRLRKKSSPVVVDGRTSSSSQSASNAPALVGMTSNGGVARSSGHP